MLDDTLSCQPAGHNDSRPLHTMIFMAQEAEAKIQRCAQTSIFLNAPGCTAVTAQH